MRAITQHVERERAIAAIIEQGRATRTPVPRWMWLAAALVGIACAVGFVAVLLADAGPREPRQGVVHPHADSGSHLPSGLVILGVGGLIGFAIGHQRGVHSSRNKP